MLIAAVACATVLSTPPPDHAAWREPMAALERVAVSVLYGSRVKPGVRIGKRENTTGFTLRVPGATREYYPAFWVRDAAMMLGGDFVGADELQGWVRLIASTQAPDAGIRLKHGLFVPPYSIPDHITLGGAPCWYPGAFDGEDQGDGTFGFLPPADDAFFFIGMVREHMHLKSSPSLFLETVCTPAGETTVAEACVRAFDSVAADPKTGLVVCSAEQGATRVDWGFCDTVRKTGECLFPSLLRWRAAKDLRELFASAGRPSDAARYEREERTLRFGIARTFLVRLTTGRDGEAMMLSATGVGRQDDVWGSAFAVWLGVLKPADERAVARHLLRLYRDGGTVCEGQVRSLPPTGEYGGYWQQCVAKKDSYQNGAFWGTPSGWFIAALRRVDEDAALQMLRAHDAHIAKYRDKGAPFECVNPAIDFWQNPRYAASAGLPYVALKRDMARR